MTSSEETLAAALNHYKAGRLNEAKQLYRGLLKTEQGNQVAWHILGMILYQQGRHEAASEHVQRAIDLQPDSPNLHTDIGVIYRSFGNQNKAIASFTRALELDPSNALACCHLGHSFKNLGQTEKAIEYYQHSLQLNPQYANAYKGLSDLSSERLYQFTRDDLVRMKTLTEQADFSLYDKKLLHYALADHFQMKRDYKQAFLQFQRANESSRIINNQSGRSFNTVEYRHGIERIIATFDEVFLESKQGLGFDSEIPVFIVGMPRSGTTLVEQILSSHPHVYGAGELYFMNELAADLSRKLMMFGGYPECATGLDAANSNWHAREYLQRIDKKAGDASRIVDKMPENYYYLGLIAILFPKAHIIHCMRDPMDTCLSCYSKDIKAKYTSDLGHLGFVYQQYRKLMAHWREALPLPVLDIVYEELVAEPELKAKELINFIGLPWDPACARPHENVGAVRTVSSLQVRRPIYTSSVKRWKRYETHLKPLSDALNNPMNA